ncbi:MAG: molybdopterin cofactor-binding domain-containing protein [Elusimicrobiota bacterium]|nr:molybdopterin cofactor-binding domain-containing protein [Elusimicrobiota bacterium]
MNINIILNGEKKSFETKPEETALAFLRRIGITSVKDGCNSEGACGTCTILLDGKAVNSCLLKAPQLDGRNILTVEGMSEGRKMHPIQEAFKKAGILQCGYCSPAQILMVKALLDRTKNPSRAEIKDALSGSICRCTGYKQIFDAVDYLTDTSVVKEENFRDDLKVVGKYTPKTDADQFSKAEPSFTEDIIPQDALVIKVLRSPHAHALIKEIDTSKAEALDGVELVLTHKNVPLKLYNTAGQGFPEPSPYDRRIVDEKVRFVGDRVAIVAARDEKTAEKALGLIDVDYEVLDAVFDVESAKKEDAPKVHTKKDYVCRFDIGGDLDKNMAASNSGGIGDMEKGFSEADTIIERTYKSARVQCTPLEPHIAYTRIKNNRLIVSTPTQVPYHIRRILASILEIKENKIRVIKEKVGGGFGSKQDMVLEEIPAYITWTTGKPAYIRYTRADEFLTRPRYVANIRVKIGAKKDGCLTAIEMASDSAAGAYGPHCLTVPMNGCSKSLPLFKCPNMRYYVKTYYTNNPISGAYQGYGAPQGSYALQLAMAELADELKIDHVKLLEKNAVEKGYRLEILKCLGEGQEGIPQVISSAGIHKALKKGARMINWGQEEKTSPDKHILTGKGVSIIQQGSGLPGIDAANATVRMTGDGNFIVHFGGTDLGTGLDTVAQKITAEMLNIHTDSIEVNAADTDVTPFDVGSYASSGTYFSGMAVYNAAGNMKELILDTAAELLNADRDRLSIKHPGIIRGPSGSLTYEDIARDTQSGTGTGQLISTGSFTTDEAPIPYGAHFAQVSVNTNTGEINVDKYYALHDSGTPINPKLAKGQIYGGVMKTIGHSLYEELKFDAKGNCLNPNFLDYKVPMIDEMPDDFKAELVYTEDKLGPYGAKSIGEVVTNGAAPALAAAIHDATGIWMRSWPFTSEKILNALNSK